LSFLAGVLDAGLDVIVAEDLVERPGGRVADLSTLP
jgi:hypothetical protein